MTLEERVAVLEQEVAQLKAEHGPAPTAESAIENGEEPVAEGKLLDGVEYPLALKVPPRKVTRLRGRIRSIRRGLQGLALSAAEWDRIRELCDEV